MTFDPNRQPLRADLPIKIRLRLTLKALGVILWGLALKVWHWRPWRKVPKKPQTPEERWEANVGDPVQPIEVMLFAKSSCKTCFGTGKLTRRIMAEQESVQGINYKQGQEVPALCGCGINKFVRLHKDELIRVQHRLFWRPKVPGAAPTRGDATRIRAMLEAGKVPFAIPVVTE